MKNLAAIVTATGLTLGLTVTAPAATLFTPGVFVQTGEGFECRVTNVGRLNRTVQILIKDLFGDTLHDSGVAVLAAGAQHFLVIHEADFNEYCEFILQGGSSSYRAVGCTFSLPDGSSRDCLDAR